VAEALAGAGARVVLADLNADEGERVAGRLEGCAFQRTDVAARDDCRRLVERTVDLFGGVDILVNNAGLQHIAPVEDFPEERWEHLIRVMLVGAFLLTKYAVPHMYRGGWGRIVNIASIHGLIASPYKSAYTAAKHGLVGFTKSVALEAAEQGVTVNAICPSYVRTPIVERQIADQAKVHGISEAEVVERIMLAPAAVKRLLEPREVAAYALFLCSDDASGITGSTQVMDAGWTAR
jgi:3-hydroxybutyrate dehydrogenase